jgi:putative transposase
VNGLGMSEILIAPRAPWQTPFAERVIGSIRRECLDLVLMLNERHLRRLLRSYLVLVGVDPARYLMLVLPSF